MGRVVISFLLLYICNILSFSQEEPNLENNKGEIKAPASLASLSITVKTQARIYIDGIYYKDIAQGSEQIDGIEPGKRRIQIIYPDDGTEMRLVVLEAGVLKQVDFTCPPIPDQQQAKRIGFKRKGNYLSASAGLNVVFPVNDTARIMNVGCNPTFYINYNLAFTTLIMSLGFFSGLSFESAKNLRTEEYNLYSAPLGFNIAFRSNLDNPIMVTAEVSSGAAFSLVVFKESEQSSYNTLVTKYFIMPAAGVGYNFNTTFGIFIHTSFLLTFFDNSIFQGVTTGIRCDFGL